MKEKFALYGINLTDEQNQQFNKYYDLLIKYNSMFNITAITEKEEVIVKHFIDSALGYKKVLGENLIDIGSGGGFPALPLKILNSNLKVTLVEATGKKCNFLTAVVKELNLKNVTVINGRAEELAIKEEYREKFDICTARAVARLNILCEYCMPLVKKGGIFLSYKGEGFEEEKECKNAVNILGGRVKEIYSYQLEGAKRTLITIEKVDNTDKKYPRSNGKIRKNPL